MSASQFLGAANRAIFTPGNALRVALPAAAGVAAYNAWPNTKNNLRLQRPEMKEKRWAQTMGAAGGLAGGMWGPYLAKLLGHSRGTQLLAGLGGAGLGYFAGKSKAPGVVQREIDNAYEEAVRNMSKYTPSQLRNQ